MWQRSQLVRTVPGHPVYEVFMDVAIGNTLRHILCWSVKQISKCSVLATARLPSGG